ncbi:hypothetical protein NIES4071_92360 [Calothrix sp. NIES-4071]|nr:hypothetical protein NIES4071_92360 [Calothrix sp. NIES-4071]BAZ63503.1 hypothetical protein NIES4105_92290 [Calothrix sp. NIES-4105]
MLVYIETNFILGISTGREVNANQLLSRINAERRLIIPSICSLEALIALEGQQKQLSNLIESLDMVISQLERNPQQNTSNEITALIASRNAANNLSNQLKPNLSSAIGNVFRVAEVITPSTNSIQKTLNNPILIRDKAMRDSLILECILEHANTQLDTQKAFLSSNIKEFGSQEARFALRTYGIIYFSDTTKLINWIDSQS